jgi:hypothetical protein
VDGKGGRFAASMQLSQLLDFPETSPIPAGPRKRGRQTDSGNLLDCCMPVVE